MTNEQRSILAHVVIDPDTWYKHAVDTFGEAKAIIHLQHKVERHRLLYEEAVKLPGYKTRAEREQIPAA